MNANTEQALNIIDRALASVQGNREMHNNFQQALQIVVQALKPAPDKTAGDKGSTDN